MNRTLLGGLGGLGQGLQAIAAMIMAAQQDREERERWGLEMGERKTERESSLEERRKTREQSLAMRAMERADEERRRREDARERAAEATAGRRQQRETELRRQGYFLAPEDYEGLYGKTLNTPAIDSMRGAMAGAPNRSTAAPGSILRPRTVEFGRGSFYRPEQPGVGISYNMTPANPATAQSQELNEAQQERDRWRAARNTFYSTHMGVATMSPADAALTWPDYGDLTEIERQLAHYEQRVRDVESRRFGPSAPPSPPDPDAERARVRAQFGLPPRR